VITASLSVPNYENDVMASVNFLCYTHQSDIAVWDTIAIIAVCSDYHTKEINTVCGENAKNFNIKSAGIYS